MASAPVRPVLNTKVLLPTLAMVRVWADDTVPAARAITARDLLTFTFGFGMVGEMFAAAQPWPVVAAAGELRLATIGPPDPPVPPDPGTWIAALGSLPLRRRLVRRDLHRRRRVHAQLRERDVFDLLLLRRHDAL